MPYESMIDPEQLPGYRWYTGGHSALSGPLLSLDRRIDRLLLAWAKACDATEHVFPPCIPARALARVDYFRSFPHLVTFPLALDPDAANLIRFAERNPMGPADEVRVTAAAPVTDVLTPAACYHVYLHYQGRTLEQPAHVTTRATCFRREALYVPLERQWSFSMRELVCVGSADEVKAFLALHRENVDRFFRRLRLPIEWRNATDPFFDPSRNPKYLVQRLEPVKTEMVFRGRLAIGSINFHRNYFGEAFDIRRDGDHAFSGCVAFGIERWMLALLAEFGVRESEWPDLGA